MGKATKREWKIRSESEEEKEKARTLSQQTGLSFLTTRICLSRGLDSNEKIKNYLSPRLEGLTDPFQVKDMDLAVRRLDQAKKEKQKIRVFGDYDVDGTSGGALLSWVFRDLEFEFDVKQPDRFRDGYGLNVQAVEDAKKEGIVLLITVDCGISSFDAAKKAQELGIDLIVVDHHQVDPQKGLPSACAIVNPQREDCESGLKQLCGCGLAFYLSMALRSHGKKEGWFENRPAPNLKQHLDLVVIATAADQVPLTGDNRILVKHGLQVLRQSTKPGVKALLDVSGISSKEVSPGHLGFVLGPRINASGRLGSATRALELLTTQNGLEALEIAQELEQLNQQRMQIQNEIWDEIKKRVETSIKEGQFQNAVVVADSNWHEGVVGIVASRVTETFHRPAIVISLREDFGKGSARTFGSRNILEAIRNCKSHLLGFGGHKYAAGLSLKPENLDVFTKAFDEAVGKLVVEKEQDYLWIDGSCDVEDLNLKTLHELEQLAPFGPGNPEPVFQLPAKMVQHRVLKGRHLKLNLKSTENPRWVEAIWFHAADQLKDSLEGKWAGVPELNKFRGRVSANFRIRDFRPF